MKKNRMFDTKGFMLVETLLVSLTISGILVYMYAQFSTINNSYQRLYDFNTPNSLYRAAALREFMMTYTNPGGTLYTRLTSKSIKCVSGGGYSGMALDTRNQGYCNGLFEALDVKQVILTRDSFDEATVLGEISDETEKVKLKRFLNTVKRYSTAKKRLIIIFNDGTMATVLFKI